MSRSDIRPRNEKIDPIKHAAIEYRRRNWMPIRVRPDKRPYGKGWQNLRLTEDEINSLSWNGKGVGILLGAPSGGLVDVDLDSPEALRIANYFLPNTNSIFGRPGSPQSHFLYMTVDGSLPQKASTKFECPIRDNGRNEKVILVELRSTGGQTIFPPSLWIDTKDASNIEEREWYEDGEPLELYGEVLLKATQKLAAAALLARCWPNTGGRNSITMPIAGMLLKSAGWRVDEARHFIRAVAVAANDEEAGKRENVVDYTLQRIQNNEHVKGIPTLIEELGEKVVTRLCAWLEIDSGITRSVSQNQNLQITRRPQVETSNEGLTNPPGILNDITRYIVETSIRPQPEFAVNAALALAGTILGRRYMSESKLRTNLYLISIGMTASGKDHPRKVVKNILNAAGLDYMLGGENIASGQGLLARVKRTPAVLFQLDEFGLMMQALQMRNSGRHNKEILINMIRLFSSADTIFIGTEYADQEKRPTSVIEYPCVSIHATSTPVTFYAALESKNVIDGFLNRFIVVDNSDKPRPPLLKRGESPEAPPTVLEWIHRVVYADKKQGNLVGVYPPSPIMPVAVEESPEAKELMEDFSNYVEEQTNSNANSGVDALWSRAIEHTIKIAMICACADTNNLLQPVIEYDHALWAIKFVGYHTERLGIQVREHIADTDFERMVNDFYIAILEAGGRGLTVREMNRRKPFRSFSSKDRKPVLETLEKAGQIAFSTVKHQGAGHPRTAYVAIE